MGNNASFCQSVEYSFIESTHDPGFYGIIQNPLGELEVKKSNLCQNFSNSVLRHPNQKFLSVYESNTGRITWISYSQASKIVKRISYGLASLETHCGKIKSLGIFSKNRYEWALIDLACMFSNIIPIGIYDSLETCIEIANRSKLKIIATSHQNSKILFKLKKEGSIPHLKQVIVFERVDEEYFFEWNELGVKLVTLEELIQIGIKAPQAQPQPDSIYTVAYTSTECKPVYLTHQQFVCSLESIKNQFQLSKKDRVVSYFPLSHVFERVMLHAFISVGASIAFYCVDYSEIYSDIEVFKPSVFLGTWEFFYFLHRDLSVSCNEKNFSEVRKLFGGNLRVLVSLFSGLESDSISFLKRVLNCEIFQVYGLTELCGLSLASQCKDNEGHILGGPLRHVEAKLRLLNNSCKLESLFFEENQIRIGELFLKSNYVQTWVQTGDIVGRMAHNGALKFLGKSEDSVCISGNLVIPQVLEQVYFQSSFVKNIIVDKAKSEEKLVALVVLERSSLEEWKTQNLTEDLCLEELVLEPYFRGDLQLDLDKYSEFLGEFKVSQAAVCVKTFQELGLVTPTFQVHRPKAKAFMHKLLTKNPVLNL